MKHQITGFAAVADNAVLQLDNTTGKYGDMAKSDFIGNPDYRIHAIRAKDGQAGITTRIGETIYRRSDNSPLVVSDIRLKNAKPLINGLPVDELTNVLPRPAAVPQAAPARGAATEAIRVRGLNKKRNETLNQFLDKFFGNWNNKKETIYVGTEATQTAPGKRRSLGDILAIVNYYYPNASEADVIKYLYRDTTLAMRSSMCGLIGKRTYYVDGRNAEILNTKTADEFGRTVKEYRAIAKA